MFKPGDIVFIEPSARIDIGFQSWSYIESHPKAVVRARMYQGDKVLPESEVAYALEWPEQFSGGISCNGTTKQRQGQFITAKHLSLCFEESREVNTVPQFAAFKEHLT